MIPTSGGYVHWVQSALWHLEALEAEHRTMVVKFTPAVGCRLSQDGVIWGKTVGKNTNKYFYICVYTCIYMVYPSAL